MFLWSSAIVLVCTLAIFIGVGIRKYLRLRKEIDRSLGALQENLSRRNALVIKIACFCEDAQSAEKLIGHCFENIPGTTVRSQNIAFQKLGKMLQALPEYPGKKRLHNLERIHQLYEQLPDEDKRVAECIIVYNSKVAGLNHFFGSFPMNMVKGLFHFNEQELFSEKIFHSVPRIRFSRA